MRSLVSAILRVLVLPYGATEGRRLVFDSVNGAILIYDLNDDLIASAATSSGTDPGGRTWIAGLTSYSSLTGIIASLSSHAELEFSCDDAHNPNALEGIVGASIPADAAVTERARITLRSPASSTFGGTFTYITCYADSEDKSQGPFIEYGGNSFGSTVVPVVHVFRGLQYAQRLVANVWQPIETWKTLPLQNGWVGSAFTGDPPSYRRGPDGRVSLQGWAENGAFAAGTVITTLPVGYRPASPVHVPVACPGSVNTYMSAVVRATGAVELYNAPMASVSLDNVSFYAADVQ